VMIETRKSSTRETQCKGSCGVKTLGLFLQSRKVNSLDKLRFVLLASRIDDRRRAVTKLYRVSVLVLTGLILLAQPGGAESKEPVPKQGNPPHPLKQLPDGHWSANQPGGSMEGYEVRTVKTGDTLWNITQEFLKDPFLWPQVWELNPNIANPHWIYPGDKLILKKMVVAAPQPEPVAPPVQPAQTPAPSAPPAAVAEVAEVPTQAPPPPAPAPSPVATYSQLYCAGFFTSEEIQPKMVVVGSEESESQTLFGERDILYLNQGTAAGVKPGDEYQVLRRLSATNRYGQRAANFGAISKYGFGYVDLGKVRVLLAHDNASTAEVVLSCEDLIAGDILVPAEQRVSPVVRPRVAFDKFAAPNDKTHGRIFYAKDFKSVIGEGDVVYLDVGKQQNVQIGDYFRILRYFTSANVSRFNRSEFGAYRSTYDAVRKVIGELVVLRVEGKTATALVTLSTQDIMMGDGVELEQEHE